MISICFYVVLIFTTSLDVHISGIPLTAESRNWVYTPVNENSKFLIFIPLRYLILLKWLPSILIPSVFNNFINFLQIILHSLFLHLLCCRDNSVFFVDIFYETWIHTFCIFYILIKMVTYRTTSLSCYFQSSLYLPNTYLVLWFLKIGRASCRERV